MAEYTELFGEVVASFPDGTWCPGTCTMIGPKLAITAMHCVYKSEKKMFTNSVTIYPGCNGPNITDPDLSPLNVVALRWNKEFEYENLDKDDWCLLILDTDISYKTGYIGAILSNDQSKFMDRKITVSGYPLDWNKLLTEDGKIHSDKPQYQYYAEGKIIHYKEGYFYHDATTMTGDSGAGMLTIYDDGQYHLIGVHAHGAEPEHNAEWNGGPNIDLFTLDQITSCLNGL